MRLFGSHTQENLQKAMQGEALAYIRYQIYASLIGKTSKTLEEEINHIAHNEKEHYKIWAKALFGDSYYDNEENILSAIVGEVEECENMYPEFARVAREEGFDDIAEKFEMVSKIECNHSWQFEDFLEELKSDNKNPNGFVCLNCGYIHDEEEPPTECPVCNHPIEYFEKL